MEINPNDEWINVSKDLAQNITNILLLLLHIIKVKSKHASLFGQNIAISYFTGCLFPFIHNEFLADGHGWDISTDMYPLKIIPFFLESINY